MNYQELSELVDSMTARPDLVSEKRVAISGAIRKFHLADTFQRDLREVILNMQDYPTTDFTWQIDTTSNIFQRFRKLYAVTNLPVRQTVSLNTLPSLPPDYRPAPGTIEIRSPADVFDGYGIAHQNYVYQAGQNIVLRLCSSLAAIRLQYFIHPDIKLVPGGVQFTSWIVDTMPEAIAAEAAGTIFKMIGKDDEFQRHAVLFAENLALLKTSEILPN